MSLVYLGGEYNAASGTRDAFGRFSDDLEAAGLPPIRVTSGDRSPAVQVSIFVKRYRQQASGAGPFGDVRTWDGSAWGFPGGNRWVRYSSEGTVAAPGTSRHEQKRSNDLAWPYNAVTTAHLRARDIAKRHNITCDGLGFGEPWHWTYWGPLGSTGAAASASTSSTSKPTSNLEVPMAFDMTRPIYRHTGINKFIVLDLLNKKARIIEPTDWEQTLINEENGRRLNFVETVEKRTWHVTDGVHRDITPEQWVAAFADFTYVN